MSAFTIFLFYTKKKQFPHVIIPISFSMSVGGRRRQEHEAFLVQYSFSLCTELMYEVLSETIKETATSEIQ